MRIFIRLTVTVPVLALALAACSSDSGGTGDREMTSPLVQARVVSVEQDNDGDGVVDDTYEFSYDADGRVTDVSHIRAEFSIFSDTYTFTYADGSLVSIDSNSSSINLKNVDGRVVAFDDEYDSFTYTYNASGQLVSAMGDLFSFDGDCEDPIPLPGEDPVMTNTLNTLLYDSAGRFVGAQGSEGGIISVEYLDSSDRPASLTYTSKCSTTPDEISVYEYNNQGLPVSATITYDDGFDQGRREIQVDYDPAMRPAQFILREVSTRGVQRQSAQTFQYNSDGLLETAVLSSSGSDPVVTNATTTFRYEAKTCVEQVFPEPIESLFQDQLATVRTYEAGLRCGFYAFVTR